MVDKLVDKLSKKLTDKRVFEGECYRGLASRRGGYVEFLTVGCSMDSAIDLRKTFEEFCERLSCRKKIEWIAVHVKEPRGGSSFADGSPVGKEHMHILWAKPYIRMDMLRDVWQGLSKTSGGIKNRTVHGSLSARSQMSRLVGYLVNQDDHHDTDSREVFYYESAGWVLQSAGNSQTKIESDGEKVDAKRGRRRSGDSITSPKMDSDEKSREGCDIST